MGTLKHRVQFYNTVATLEEAGVPPLRAFQQRMPGIFGPAARDILALLKQGDTVSGAMSRLPRVFSSLEINLVHVGETTGRRATVYQSLRDWFQLVSRLRSILIAGLIYPALVYHVAAVLIPLITIFTDDLPVGAAAVRALLFMAFPWLLLLAAKSLAPVLSALPGLGGLILRVPLLGGVLYRLDSTRFFMALSLCLRSGLGGIGAVRMAASCCRNATLRRRFEEVADIMKAEGCAFSAALAERLHPHDRNTMILELMHTGELAGTTDEAAERIANICREEAETAMTRAAVVLPVLVYLCIAAYIGYKILTFYGKLYAPVRELLE
ncbi:MAG: type II secretion system F family protein [Lentisphaeria bacterium]|nr:type II secretion system F family protein [Lentisphaeria bacterium]